MLMRHNEKCYMDLVTAFRDNRDVLFIHGTGLGKSFVFLELKDNLFRGMRICYVIPKHSVKEGISGYDEYKAGGGSGISFVTYNYFTTPEKAVSLAQECDVIVFDEAHHLGSGKYGCNARALFPVMRDKGGMILGLTATNIREDKTDVALYFSATVLGMSAFGAIREGLIPPFEYLVCRDDMEQKLGYGKKAGDYKKRLSYEESIPMLKETVARNPRDRWLCFFLDISSLERYEDVVRDIFPKDYTIIKITTKHDTHVEDISRHKKTVIMSVNKLLEGIHVPHTDGIILFRNVSSLPVFQQILGRVVHVGDTTPPLVLDCTKTAIKMLAKLLKEEREQGNTPSESSSKPLLYCSLVNTEHFDLTRLLALADGAAAPWTEEEMALIRKHYGRMTNRELHKLIPAHSASAIQKKAAEIGLESELKGRAWTDDEISRMMAAVQECSGYKELASRMPGRDVNSVKNKCRKLGITFSRSWSDKDDAYLKANYAVLDEDELCRSLGRSKTAVKNRAVKLGLKKTARIEWTDEQILLIKENYGICDRNKLARIVGAEPAQVTSKAFQLGLRKGHAGIWSSDMDLFLKQNYGSRDRNWIASELGLKPGQVTGRAHYLGLAKRFRSSIQISKIHS